MGVVRWVIMRHREGFNSEVLSDDEDDSLPKLANTCDSHRAQSTNKSDVCNQPIETGEKSHADKGDASPDPQSQEIAQISNTASLEKLPSLVLPTTNNKEQKTPRKGILITLDKWHICLSNMFILRY